MMTLKCLWMLYFKSKVDLDNSWISFEAKVFFCWYAKIMTWSLHYYEEIDANQIHSFYGKFVKLPAQTKF